MSKESLTSLPTRIRTPREAELELEVSELRFKVAELQHRLAHTDYTYTPFSKIKEPEIVNISDTQMKIVATCNTHYDNGSWQIIGRAIAKDPKDDFGFSHFVSEPDLVSMQDLAYYLAKLHEMVLFQLGSLLKKRNFK